MAYKGFWLGKKRSEETNRKISESLKGRFGGKNHPLWDGGRHKGKDGYIRVYSPEHPRISGKIKYVMEHILVMEKHIGRHLTKLENIHHLNGVRDDNRIENLILLSPSEHANLHNQSKNPSIGNINIEAIIKLYIEDKMSLERISNIFSVSYWTIRQRLIDAGIKLRRPTEIKRCKDNLGRFI